MKSILILLFIAISFALKQKQQQQQQPKIEHFVSIMLENRAFDHYLGWMKEKRPEIDGLTGKEFNYINPFDTTSEKVFVNKRAKDVDVDPHHDVPDTNQQAFGSNANTFLDPAPMCGFVANAETYQSGLGKGVMSCHAPEEVPILSTLANEFVLFDRWFASAPASTQPNRLYFHSATSHGVSIEPGYSDLWSGFPQKTIFEALEDANKTWMSYYPQTTTLYYFSRLRAAKYSGNFAGYSHFLEDAKNGKLPTYSFIEPRWYNIPGWPAQDQHPTHPVSAGEALVKEVYEALRASPKWDKTALLITYDEHGGYYDHVGITKNTPNPDGINAAYPSPPLNFTYSGVRVPAILVSPWVKKGHVEHTPPVRQSPNSQYEHSSLSKTFSTMFGTQLLTKRDLWAGDFSHLFNEPTPRTDCPVKLPNPNFDIDKHVKYSPLVEISNLGKTFCIMAAALNGKEIHYEDTFWAGKTENDIAHFVQQQMTIFHKRTYGKIDERHPNFLNK